MPRQFEPRLKVKRAKLPIASLNTLEQRGLREFNRLLDAGMEVIEAQLEQAMPDPDEEAVAGQQAKEPLQKSVATETDALTRTRALRQLARRTEYGAPTTPRQFTEEEVDRATGHLPWHGGKLQLNPHTARTSNTRSKGAEDTVPLSQVRAMLEPVDAAKYREALLDRSERIEAVKHPGSHAYTIIKGASTVLAGMTALLPAMTMKVHRPREALPPTETDDSRPHLDPEDTFILARSLLRDKAYRLPSVLEPIAETARKMEYPLFEQLYHGQETDREAAARVQAEDALNKVARLEVGGTEAGLRRARAALETRLDLRKRAVEEGDAQREDMATAKEEAEAMAKEDGLPPIGEIQTYPTWAEARKGKQPQRVADSELTSAYAPGDKVEVRNATGQWVKAEVTRNDGSLRTKDETGSRRTITEPTQIRPRENEDLTPSPKPGIISDMTKDITIPRFSVRIPMGSNSHRIERELEPITEEMNRTPLRVNKATWERNREETSKDLLQKSTEAHEMAGREFRIGSSKEVAILLFEEMGLPTQRVSPKTGEPSVDKETLIALAAMGEPLPEKIMVAREAQSRLSQLQKWEPYATAHEVQGKWLQLGQPHGRYACEDPNLCNRVVEIRETVVPQDGYYFLSMDLGQAEYVTLASLSKDPTLIDAFGSETDFHAKMWEEIEAAAPNALQPADPRAAGKEMNFAILYLMQPYTLAKKLGTDAATAKALIRAWTERAPVAAKYINDKIVEIQRTGLAATKFGRERSMPAIRKARGPQLHELTKTLWHHHNAGTAAELLKVKQIRTWKALRREGLDYEAARVAINMFDEIILEVKEEHREDVERIARAAFDQPIKGFLPFKTDQRSGYNWKEISK